MKPTGAEMLSFLRERFGSNLKLNEAISNYRASKQYRGTGATVMDAVTVLYEQEKSKPA